MNSDNYIQNQCDTPHLWLFRQSVPSVSPNTDNTEHIYKSQYLDIIYTHHSIHIISYPILFIQELQTLVNIYKKSVLNSHILHPKEGASCLIHRTVKIGDMTLIKNTLQHQSERLMVWEATWIISLKVRQEKEKGVYQCIQVYKTCHSVSPLYTKDDNHMRPTRVTL